ncbi:unnamed protein product [Musa acuminata subsp. malaccensis]|uniref:ubiquitinyl hydrolase 1 n=1 Tax=Musa acuminata subsp. malaccensis TaxID=214687 RepID=A0A804IJ55_MUSAM|nr:unnamed protein product [Musa acuminata subsp. malaccensis]
MCQRGSEVVDDGHCRRDSAGSIERSCIYGGFPRRRPSSSLKRANCLPQNCLIIFTVLCSEEKVQLTGIYDLVAVLTHEGRSADYVFWVKQENGKWIQYDDHNPIPPRVERILQSYLAAVIGTWQKHLHG